MTPICFFDTETTGTNINDDKIIEIAIIKVDGFGQKEYHWLINPGIPIPQSASDIHGITDEKVADKPKFDQLAPEIFEIMNGCHLAGFNSNRFDIPLLYNHFSGVGINWDLSMVKFIDVGVIYKRMEERTLSAAVQFYLGREHTDAHGAMSDTQATFDVYKAMRIRYKELGQMKADELDLFCNYDKPRVDLDGKFEIDADGDYVYTFGKHKGVKAKNEKGFADWMLKNDFLPDAKAICRKILYGGS